MEERNFRFLTASGVALLVMLWGTSALAQKGKLRVRAIPTQAYVFVDGIAIGDASLSGQRQLLVVRLNPGERTVGVYNYGYKPQTHVVNIDAGKTAYLDVVLEPLPGSVSGPWGRIQIEGGGHAAVLLNGKTPEYLVGEADDFNNDFGLKQELLVPPGTHQLTLVRGDSPIWSGSVTVAANQRVIVYINRGGEQKTTNWPRGEKLGALPRFKAGIASATVAVAPVSGQLAASPSQVGCGEPARLTWSSQEAARAELSGLGEVPPSGERAVEPRQTTTYNFTAAGPGGVATSSATVSVQSGLQASLQVSPGEIRYRRVGDKVVDHGTGSVTWSTSGAQAVSIDPFGPISASGSRTVQPVPSKTDPGPVDETVRYTLSATNPCGGSETRTAQLRIVGSIEPAVVVRETSVVAPEAPVTVEVLEMRLGMNSIYFPSGLPTRRAPLRGLLASQQRLLNNLARDFKKYLQLKPEAHLILQAHADTRGSRELNQALSERRALRVKQFLIENEVPEVAIETRGLGKAFPLGDQAVKELIANDPNLSPQERTGVLRNFRVIALANNRRVDVSLSTTGQQSARFFPYNDPDSWELLGRPKPTVRPARRRAPGPRRRP